MESTGNMVNRQYGQPAIWGHLSRALADNCTVLQSTYTVLHCTVLHNCTVLHAQYLNPNPSQEIQAVAMLLVWPEQWPEQWGS